MKIYLVITDGPQRGQKVVVRDGLQIGRAVPGLRLKDPKASALHAKVEIADDGNFWLVDQGSTNKIKTQGGRRDRVELTPGLEFSIGSTGLSVIREEKAPPQKASDIELPRIADSPAEWRKALVWDPLESTCRHASLSIL